MKRNLIIILIISVAWMASCKKEDPVARNNVKEGYVPVTFSMSMDLPAYNGVDYIPMKSTIEDTIYNRTSISNQYLAIISKKVNDMWIIDKVEKPKFTNEIDEMYRYIDINRDLEMLDFNTELRPGDYRITVITGLKSITLKDIVKEGYIIGSATDTLSYLAPFACTYRLGSGAYNPGENLLTEEIFSGMQEFTINKTDDLHSSPRPNRVDLKLYRRVGKFRIIFNDKPSPVEGNQFAYNPYGGRYGVLVMAEMTATSEQKFCPGLDIWGRPFYYPDQNDNITRLKYWVMSHDVPVQASNGDYYFIQKPRTSTYAPHFFTADGKDVTFTVTGLYCEIYSGGPKYYYGRSIENQKLIHNTVTGLTFSVGEYRSDDGNFNLILQTDEDATTIFDAYEDYR